MFKLFFCTIYTGTESFFLNLSYAQTWQLWSSKRHRDEHWRGIVLNVKLVIDGEIRAQGEWRWEWCGGCWRPNMRSLNVTWIFMSRSKMQQPYLQCWREIKCRSSSLCLSARSPQQYLAVRFNGEFMKKIFSLHCFNWKSSDELKIKQLCRVNINFYLWAQ